MSAVGTHPSPARFHHADAGTSEQRWLADPRWDEVRSIDVPALAHRYPRLLVVAAHPDDETLGAGGLIAELADLGVQVTVLHATAGEASHPTPDAAARDRLGARRRAEAVCALAALASGAEVVNLGFPDGGVDRFEDALTLAVAAHADEGTLVVAPWTGDAHPDHDAAGRAAAAAAARTGAAVVHYPVWLWHWATPELLPWDLVAVLEPSASSLWRKRAALEEFVSQLTGWDPAGPRTRASAPILGEAVLARAHRLVETFVDPDAVLPGSAPDTVRERSADRSEVLDAMYDGGPDPWRLLGSFYEDRRRDLVLAALARRRYGRVLEVGCADGGLTEALARRADHVVALDTSPRAVAAARARVPQAEVVLGTAPHDLPDGPFDLVVLAEVGYFLAPRELLATLRRVTRVHADGGEVLLCHWQHAATGIPLDGVLVHDQAVGALGGPASVRIQDEDLLVEGWSAGPSVAEREGRA